MSMISMYLMADMTEEAKTPTKTATEAAAARPSPADRRMLAVALTATFMASFDLFVVNVATEALRTDLRASDAALELVVAGYALAYAAGLITGGRLGDRFGYRRMFVTGMLAFTVTSLLCGLAQDAGQLVAARLAQGLAAAVMVPQVLSLVTARYPAEHRGRATAWYGATAGLGSIAGQLLGGVLLQADVFGLGWRSVFLVNVPVGAAAALLAFRALPALSGARRGFDGPGALGVTLFLALLLIPATLGREAGWPVWTWLCLAAAVPAGWATWRRQRALRARGGEPVLDPALLRNRPYVTLLVAVGLFQTYFGGYMFALALLLQSDLGLGPFTAALVFLPQAVLFSAGALASGRLTARFGSRSPLLGGVLVLAGLTLLAGLLALSDSPGAAALLPALALNGLGNGLLLPPLIGAALSRVAPTSAGAASGLLNTAQQAAGSLGVALLGALWFTWGAVPVCAASAALAATACVLLRRTR
ncbi:MFS transporter [Streptomyces xanthii]|uniref:MFS transporter n=1 Tax=Streptomyces xanthii TaxID=2768069 RepID=A0A7H1BCA5_9ACTN|nr:MFS transporter [Streptomyces xanthii]QNS06360.1 MFS transporter [Streptomyces xanthii]